MGLRSPAFAEDRFRGGDNMPYPVFSYSHPRSRYQLMVRATPAAKSNSGV
jgi:hypothetical protein